MARFLHHAEEFRALHAPYGALLEEYYGRLGLASLESHPYPTSLDAWTEQRQTLHRRLVVALGLRPELVAAPAEQRGDLAARIVGEVDRSADGYRIEQIEYQSHPGFYVSATLYRPAAVPAGSRLPAVYSPHGHWPTGKQTRHIQIRSANLARRGYVVLVADTIGQAERTFMGHRDPVAHALLYAGASLPGLQVWDNLRALDYLCSRPDVDPERIGVTGASGGGNHTMYLAAIDGRVAVAVPVCAVEMFDAYVRKSQCVCETVPGLLTFADKPHLLGLIAPRPQLVMNGLRDAGFPTLSSRRAYDHLRRIYALYPGGGERLARYETNVEHSYDRAMRERAYAWFDRWLQGRSPEEAAQRAREAPTWVEAEEDDTLQVWGPRGAGRRPDGALTLKGYYATLTPARTAVAAGAEGRAALRRRVVEEAFGGWPEREPLQVEEIDRTERSDCDVETLVYWSEPEVPVPALLFRPRPTAGRRQPAVLYVSPAGKQRTPELRAVHELVRSGALVLAIDYRGQGETAGVGPAQGELPAVERGILLQRPLFAGRVWDVLRGVAYLRGRPDVDPARVFVWGDGAAALLALHAGALDEGVAGAVCLGLPESYRAAGEGDAELAPWLVVPGLLRLVDIPDLRALVAPRPCPGGATSQAAELLVPLLADLATAAPSAPAGSGAAT